jgi:ABC-type sugar transport system substrate-binding protein
MEACKKAGVKVILLDRTVKGTPGVDFITGIRTNAEEGGARVAQWIVDNYSEGANIVEITGTPGATTSLDRTKGFANVIKTNPNLVMLDTQVGNFMRSDAQTAAENLIQAHGDKIDVIVSQSDEMTFGVLQAIDGMGLTPGKDIVVVSIGDGSSAMLDEVIAGRVAAVSECTPYLAQTALEIIEKVEAGETVDTNIWANDRFFTIENAAEEQAKATW